jgi:Mce-associated membrane protein
VRRVAWWVLVAALATATIAAASLGGWQLLAKNRQPPPVADQPAARRAAIQAASDCTVKILSYTPDTLEQDFAATRACLSGEFLSYYNQFTKEVVGPAARTKRVTTSATVQQAGVETLGATSATILIFVKQQTSSTEQTQMETSSSVRVSLTKVKGTWLINQFNPT